MLKQYHPAGPERANSAGAKSKAKSAAPPKEPAAGKATIPNSKARKATPAAVTTLRTTIGNAGSTKRKIADGNGINLEAAASKAVRLDISDGLSAADKEIVDSFENKFAKLKIVDPPLSEPAFKSKINELLSSCHSFLGEIKTKKRSASRRNNQDDQLVAALEAMEEDVQDHVKILKCTLANLCVALSFNILS